MGLASSRSSMFPTFPLQVNFRAGEKVRFLGSYNYGAWIDHAEVRIISTASGASVRRLMR